LQADMARLSSFFGVNRSIRWLAIYRSGSTTCWWRCVLQCLSGRSWFRIDCLNTLDLSITRWGACGRFWLEHRVLGRLGVLIMSLAERGKECGVAQWNWRFATSDTAPLCFLFLAR
jgi:hypothetical protein